MDTTVETDTRDLAAVINAATEFGKIDILPITAGGAGAASVASVPTGRTLVDLKPFLDKYATKPDRRVGQATLQDLDSLAAWANRHKDAGSVLFCNVHPSNPSMTVYIDYHMEGEDNEASARFGGFKGHYAFPLEKRWKEWMEKDGKFISQVDFADFIDDHVNDLLAPAVNVDGNGAPLATQPDEVSRFLAMVGGRTAQPNEVVTLSRGLAVTASGKASMKVDIQSGEVSAMFEEVHTDSNGVKLDVPKLFLIAIPVFHLTNLFYRVPVRIRYRVAEGKVVWQFKMFGAAEIFDQAVRDAAAKVQEATGLPLFYGTTG